MWFFFFTMLLVVILVAAIWMGRQAAEREREELEQRQQARQFKHRLEEINDVAQALITYDGDNLLLEAIGQFRINQVKSRLDILGEAEGDPNGELAAAQTFLTELPETLEKQKSRLPDEEHELNQMKKLLFKGIKLIKLMQSHGEISDSEALDHAKRLRIRLLKAEVNAYIQQGRSVLESGERSKAAAYFKHAKEMLVATSLRFPERASMIKRISRMIWGIYSSQEDGEELQEDLDLTEDERPDADESAEDIVARESASLATEAGTYQGQSETEPAPQAAAPKDAEKPGDTKQETPADSQARKQSAGN